MRALASVFATLLLASTARASTYVVDDDGGPGVDFTDMPAAIAAAQPGDLILVQPGNYSAFTLSLGVTVVGYGAPVIAPSFAVYGLPAGQRVVVTGLRPTSLTVEQCQGPVVLQDLGALRLVSIDTARDVRLRLVDAAMQPGSGDAAIVFGARVEWVASTLRGADGAAGAARDGGSGLRAVGSARVHLVRCNALGGRGRDASVAGEQAGHGGAGLRVDGGELILAGGNASTIRGGPGGVNGAQGDCSLDGAGGPGCWVPAAGTMRHSEAQISGADYHAGAQCTFVAGIPIGGQGPVTQAAPPDPILRGTTHPRAGQPMVYTLRAPPGSTAVVRVGRSLALQATPGVVIEDLVGLARTFAVPPVPAGGEVEWGFVVPASLPVGFVFVAQMDVTLPGGELRRTNSIVSVLR